MDSKLIFFDVDGTIWDWHQNIPESTREAFKRLHANGHKAFICSGRGRAHIREKKLFDLGFDGIVAAGGCHVEIAGQIVYERIMPPEVTKLIVETVKECNIPTVLEGPQKHWISKRGFENDSFVKRMRECLGEDGLDLEDYTEDMRINKFSSDRLTCSDHKKLIKRLSPYFNILEYAAPSDEDNSRATIWSDEVLSVLEAFPKGESKGAGIKKVIEYLNFELGNTYGIGDSANDIGMFENVAHGICMGNGSPEAKAHAEYVTDALDKDGLYKALRHYNLI